MDLFNTASAYANILVQAKLLAEREQKDDNAAHALNNRLHNNAFCGLLYEGADFKVIDDESGRLIRIDFNNNSYVVPDRAVRNILRNDYERIIGSKEVVSVNKEEAETKEISSDIRKEISKETAEMPRESASDTVISTIETDESVSKSDSDESKKQAETGSKDAMPKVENNKKTEPVRGKGIIVDEDAFSVGGELDHAIVSINEDGSLAVEARKENDVPEKKPEDNTPLSTFIAYANDIESDLESEDEEPDFLERRPIFKRKNIENVASKDNNTESNFDTAKEDQIVKHGFFRKKTDAGNNENIKTIVKPAQELSRKGFFSKKDESMKVAVSSDAEKENDKPVKPLFGFTPKRPKLNKEKEYVVPEEIKVSKLELFDDEKEPDHSNDRGKLFNHIHTIVLKRSFGAAEIGPYRFIIWPSWIYNRTTGTAFAEILVHVTDPNDKEYIFVTQKRENEINMTIDGKTFKVYGTWNSGIFTSHISLTGKTASIYQPIEEIKKNVPEDFSNEFLDQFRLEKKGQPSLFIVPFKCYNGGEEYIPIIGFVELNGVKTALPRLPRNELRYTYGGIERVVRGFWKEGVFDFTSDDANRLILFSQEGA
ncbi:MAG: hypothetical protein J6I76_10315 [Oribacterium sp.]|nr:hypothetical protein [Oribacterium sp.]